MSQRLSAADARRLLARVPLTSLDRSRLDAILVTVGAYGLTQVAAALDAAFPGNAAADTRNRALLRLRDTLATAAQTARVQVGMCLSPHKAAGAARELWFEGRVGLEPEHRMDELDQVGDRLVEDAQGIPLYEPRIRLTERRDGKPVVRCFLSYAREDMEVFQQLRRLLQIQLQLSKRYAFELWRDSEVLPGEAWDAEIRDRLRECHLGILLVSPVYFTRPYILDVELPALLAGTDASVPGKRVVPAALKRVEPERHDLRGVEHRQIFWDERGRPFSRCRGEVKDDWAAALAHRLEEILDRYADVDEPPQPAIRNVPERIVDRAGTEPAEKATRRFLPDLVDVDTLDCLIEDAAALPASLSAFKPFAEAPRADHTVHALEHLLAWVRDPKGPRLFALLGEYGMGKTVTCQRLVRALEDADDLTPLYFDLRRLVDLRSRPTPTLEQVLDDCIQRGWRADPGHDHPTGRELIARARTEELLFVFDGLDEALVHLTEVDGLAFTRELLRVQADRESKVRILVSCRTHFFRTLQDQETHLRGQDRGRVEADQFGALLLTPLREDQVRTYFKHALSGIDPDVAMEVVRSVHNLEELSGRPYTLWLLAELLPDIERQRALGRPVYGVTLYRTMVERWMSRDQGKHHLLPEHKAQLMTWLAAWMWRRGTRTVPAVELEDTFHEWLDSQPELERRYRQVSVEKLDEDLRTATFLVREDGETSGFRFAHSSMQEYFLARYLYDRLQADHPAAWSLPAVSAETWDFFAQHLLDGRPELVRRLGSWATAGDAVSRELLLRYAMRARTRDWPTPRLVGLDVRGVHLQGDEIVGPLDLSGSRWDGATLRQTRWRGVTLDGASFVGADLRFAEWQDVDASGACFDGICCDGMVFRRVVWTGCSWEGARGHRAKLIEMEVPPWAVEAGSTALIAPTALAIAEARVEVLGGHHGGVVDCAWSPDGTLVLTASHDTTVRLWDAVSWETLAVWEGHQGSVHGCAWSPDGTRAVAAGADRALRIWDVGSDESAAVWRDHTDRVHACKWSPDGSRILSAGPDGTLRVWDAETGSVVGRWKGHEGPVQDCAWSPDGEAAVSVGDGGMRLWDTRSGTGRWVLKTDTPIRSWWLACDWSPDGTRILAGAVNGRLLTWSVSSGAALQNWQAHSGNVVYDCIFSPNGTRFLSASLDGTLCLWTAGEGDPVGMRMDHGASAVSCAWSPNIDYALSTSMVGSIRVWDTRTGGTILAREMERPSLRCCAWSPDGARILTDAHDGTLRLWDATSGEAVTAWEGHAGRSVLTCSFSPDGRRALSAGEDGDARLWEVSSGRLLGAWPRRAWARACVWSPDGARILSQSDGTSFQLWDIHTGETVAIWEGVNGDSWMCTWSLDGKHVLATGHRALHMWEVASGERRTITVNYDGSIWDCAWSPDGAQVASADNDGNLRIFDATSGEPVAEWRGHNRAVRTCTWSPDGARLLSGGEDGVLRVWEPSTGQSIANWRGHRGCVNACAWSPDGARVISVGDDGALRLWDATDGAPLRVAQVSGADHAVYIPGDRSQGGRIIEASEGAWRWLGWRVRDESGRLDTLPAEAFGPLPAPRRLER
jgi:WD40 repeat protein